MENNKLEVLLFMNTDLNLVNSRLIDVLMLPEKDRIKYQEEIKKLREEKKRLQKIIKEFIEK